MSLFKQAIQAHSQEKIQQALKLYLGFLKENPNHFDCLSNLAIAYYQLMDFDRAMHYAYKALSINPKHGNTYNTLGLIYTKIQLPEVALTHYKLCLHYELDHEDAWKNAATALVALKNYQEAIPFLREYLRKVSDDGYAMSALVHFCLQIMDWSSIEQDIDRIKKLIDKGDGSVDMFSLLFFCDTPDLLYKAALNAGKVIENRIAALKISAPTQKTYKNDRQKIRIGYFTADVKAHPVGFMTMHLYQNHDREKFEIYCYGIAATDESHVTHFIKKNTDCFRDLSKLDDQKAYQLMCDDQLDIVVDLVGYTQGHRQAILAMKPAPVIINYLGYLGSMGTNYHDYIIGDDHIIGKDDHKYYSEKPLYIPSAFAYQRIAVDHKGFDTRKEHHLPEEGFIFCFFNQIAKINGEVLDAWMRILTEAPNSYLWLVQYNIACIEQIYSHAQQNGLSKDRFIFAKTIEHPLHQCRYKVADMALDSWPCGGGMTTSDALYNGCPVLTIKGKNIISRATSSQLQTLQLSSLIANDIEDYIQKAINLAEHPKKAQGIRKKITQSVKNSLLFDGSVTQELEKHYLKIAPKVKV